MRIKRIKALTSFRGLHAEYELEFNQRGFSSEGIDPICFVGLNGSGKSNVLEVLAEVFYYLEMYHKADRNDSKKFDSFKTPFGFEIDYMLPFQTYAGARPEWSALIDHWGNAKANPTIRVIKLPDEFPEIQVIFSDKTLHLDKGNQESAILPSRIIAYSSGMNELLSNPFIKIDFQYFDELQQKSKDSANSSLAMNRMFFLNYGSNKLITLSNFLFDADDFNMSEFKPGVKAEDFGGINLSHIKQETGIEDLSYFSINMFLEKDRLAENQRQKDEQNDKGLPPELNIALDRLIRCSTFHTESFRQTKRNNIWLTKLYFWVNKDTKTAFRNEFGTAYELYRHLYFLQLLNCGLISQTTRDKVAQAKAGDFENLSAIIPRYEKEKLFFDVGEITFLKHGKRKVGYRQLSDGEHQLLQVIGSLLLMDTDGTLFLYDEPETHFNPDWRSKFVQLASQSINKNRQQELVLTTHSPYIVSDCRRENVYIFSRQTDGKVSEATPAPVKTFGTSVSILANKIFSKEESISDKSLARINEIKSLPLNTLDDIQAAKEASRELGESVEKVLLFRELILREEELKNNA